MAATAVEGANTKTKNNKKTKTKQNNKVSDS